MSSLRLLERLRLMARDPEQRGAMDPALLYRSVLRHLGKLLNTRRGSAMMDPDFGLPDFTDLAGAFGAESLREMEQAIRHVIEHYEPRLVNVRVSVAPTKSDPLSLRFTVDAGLVLEEGESPVEIQTVLGPDGAISISS